jgi:glycolate oxidase iron-sulfur subunit
MRQVLPHRDRITMLTNALELYERSGLPRVVGAALERVAPGLARTHAMRPVLPDRSERGIETGRTWPAEGERRARVALFLGCVASEWFAGAHRATIRVLTANGVEVVVPSAQTCCGALQRHAGLTDEARLLLAENANAFPPDLDAVVVNAAGCGASLKEPLDDGLPQPRYVDVCELLHELGLRPPPRPVRRRVAYDQPCHLLHGQRIPADAVESLLRAVPELELVPLAGSDRCCGAGGVYNLLQPAMADAVLAEKVAAVRASGADTVVTGNPGCLMQIRAGLARRAANGTPRADGARPPGPPEGPLPDVLHPVQVLAEAYP